MDRGGLVQVRCLGPSLLPSQPLLTLAAQNSPPAFFPMHVCVHQHHPAAPVAHTPSIFAGWRRMR